MGRDEFFDGLFNDSAPAAEDIKLLRQQAYEERVIKYVFTECGIKPPSWGKLAVACRNATGQQKMHFDWFNGEYRQFPGRLVGARIPYIHGIKLPELFKPVVKNKLIRFITKRLADAELDPGHNAYVFVFPVIKTKFCAHSLITAGQELPPKDTARLQFVAHINGCPRPMYIEPLKTLCCAIGNQWASE